MYRNLDNGFELDCLKVLCHSQSGNRDHFGIIWNDNGPFTSLEEMTDYEK
jgi:hypothetical protein